MKKSRRILWAGVSYGPGNTVTPMINTNGVPYGEHQAMDRGKVAGACVNHLPLSSEERVKCYLSPTSGPSWSVLG